MRSDAQYSPTPLEVRLKQIELHSKKYPGLYALVDDEDFEFVSQYRWRPLKMKNTRTFYAQANMKVDGKRTAVLMHRLIMGFPDCQVDHVSRDGLDCRRNNLRLATGSQNQGNQAKCTRKCTSQYKGVHWNKPAGKW
jgi:hypothetical protein